ncbi:nitrate- and nitrite sensing domain-containing protein [Streptomyces sp. NPDC051183]|uniref:sensor histidine kinase n=1 Tax=Streptomyces sp. NPDC051183 TaxID=3155165 RepID=UPI00343696C3
MSMNWLRQRRLGTQLALVLALPVTLALALALPQAQDGRARVAAAATAEQHALLSVAAAGLARALENERDAYSLAGGKATEDVGKRRAATDAALADFRTAAARSAADPRLAGRLERAGQALEGLPKARGGDMTRRSALLPAIEAYASVIEAVDVLVPADGPGARGSGASWAPYSLAAGSSALSAQRSLLNSPLTTASLTDEEKAFLTGQEGVRRHMLGEYRAAAADSDPGADTAVDDGCVAGPVAGALAGHRPAPADWVPCSSRVLDRMHGIEAGLLNEALRAAAAAHADARSALVTRITAVLAALVVCAVVAALAARRLVRRLHRLRRAALKAQNELPVLGRRMASTHDPARLTLDFAPVDLGARDEVGDLARAFDSVVKEAVHQTSQQAVLRAAVHAKLASMSRRGHVLVHRQLDVLSWLQMSEHEPRALEALFHLDHLATRMRRHGETVLALAGEDPGRMYREDAPLVDVLRAAAAEVEDYTRADVDPAVPEVFVRARAVHGLTHMMAELIENALKFSPPDRSVDLSAEPAADGGVVVRVRDFGAGIPGGQLDTLNVALQSELPVDWVRSDCSGLYVVNCLAALHGARVYLDSSPHGTTVVVALPADLVVSGPATVHAE